MAARVVTPILRAGGHVDYFWGNRWWPCVILEAPAQGCVAVAYLDLQKRGRKWRMWDPHVPADQLRNAMASQGGEVEREAGRRGRRAERAGRGLREGRGRGGTAWQAGRAGRGVAWRWRAGRKRGRAAVRGLRMGTTAAPAGRPFRRDDLPSRPPYM